jgi:hypothetical protein
MGSHVGLWEWFIPPCNGLAYAGLVLVFVWVAKLVRRPRKRI